MRKIRSVQLQKNLLVYFKRIILFPVWLYIYSWKFWYKFSTHSVVIVWDMMGLGIVLRNLLAPFRRDKTFAGYLVGIVIRIFWTAASIVFLVATLVFVLTLTTSFYALPYLIYRFLDPYFIPFYYMILFGYYLYLLVRKAYWGGIERGNLTKRLADQVWIRLELDPDDAGLLFDRGPRENFVQYLHEHELTKDDFISTKKWVLRKEYRKQAWKFWRDEFFVRRKGVDVGWVAGFLPELKHFSVDLTHEAAAGHIPHVYGREKELEKILTVLGRPSQNNILLVGEAGVGKTSLVYAIAWEILGQRAGLDIQNIDDLIKPLEGKKVIELHTAGMVGGTAGRGDLEARLGRVLRELKAGETILFVNQIESFIQAGLIGYLTPLLSSTRFPIIASTTPKVYRESFADYAEFVSELEVIQIEPPSIGETIRILQGYTSAHEKYGRIFTYPALHGAAELSEKYIHNQVLPNKAIDVLVQSMEVAESRVVELEDVQYAISQSTGIPVGSLKEEEVDKLLNLEQLMKQQIIGQDAAVREIARAIRRARTGVGSQERPIASLLFVGPTGVGKTLTSKTLAQVYFTSQKDAFTSDVALSQLVNKSFVRFDMSEFSELGSVDNFIERITREISEKPFSVLLLDEFEKAEPPIHNLFLQVFEDGRMSNDSGQVVDFRNAIIICTSNAVTAVPDGVEERSFIDENLTRVFRPELINRFDGIVMFHPLTEKQMEKVVLLELGNLYERLKQTHEIQITWTDGLVKELARLGFDPKYGARPLRRIIQDYIEDALAQKLLRKELQSGDDYKLTVHELQP